MSAPGAHAPGADGPGGHRPGANVSPRWADWRARADLEEYAARWDHQAASGAEVHGEADLVASFEPGSVLDAGCGAGRVAIELARRGIDVIGVDLDDDLLTHARRRAPDLDWRCADLASLDLGRRFDLIVQAGNVLNYCRPADRAAIVARSAEHLAPGGRLVVGFSVEPESGVDSGIGVDIDIDIDSDIGVGGSHPDPATNLDVHLRTAAEVGLELESHWSTWDRQPAEPASGYAVVVHRRVTP